MKERNNIKKPDKWHRYTSIMKIYPKMFFKKANIYTMNNIDYIVINYCTISASKSTLHMTISTFSEDGKEIETIVPTPNKLKDFLDILNTCFHNRYILQKQIVKRRAVERIINLESTQ